MASREDEDVHLHDDEDEHEEALSLCDLPVKYENLHHRCNPFVKFDKPIVIRAAETELDDEFDFGSSVGSHLTQPQMCAADEVFFQGQILPTCLSAGSSENSSKPIVRRCISRSESMDHASVLRLSKSISSRSSTSSKSHDHSSSTTANNNHNHHHHSSAAKITRPKAFPNLFHSCPSPKPQVRIPATTTRQGSLNGGRTGQKTSSTWDFFRLGLVRTPGMELNDLKNRNSNNNNVNNNSNGGNNSVRPRVSVDKRSSNGILSGVSCKFSVETVPNSNVVMKSSNSRRRASSDSAANQAAREIREKVLVDLKKKKQKQMMKISMKEKKMKDEGKVALMSHHRTLEWLKELSHASFPDEGF